MKDGFHPPAREKEQRREKWSKGEKKRSKGEKGGENFFLLGWSPRSSRKRFDARRSQEERHASLPVRARRNGPSERLRRTRTPDLQEWAREEAHKAGECVSLSVGCDGTCRLVVCRVVLLAPLRDQGRCGVGAGFFLVWLPLRKQVLDFFLFGCPGMWIGCPHSGSCRSSTLLPRRYEHRPENLSVFGR